MPPQWLHITFHTYGSWLYGDPRGFRTRHHREHIDGDYKNPPPAGKYDAALQRSKALLKQPVVRFTPEYRRICGAALRDRLRPFGEVLCIALASTHAHVQMKLDRDRLRDVVGLAKKHAWFVAREHGWIGKMWAKRGKATPIVDRNHQLRTFYYICKHANEGAWVWTFRDDPAPAVSAVTPAPTRFSAP